LELHIDALAAAVWSAQQAQTEAWVRAGVDPKARFASHREVLWVYDAALDAGEAGEAELDAELLTNLVGDDLSRAGVDAELMASAEASASATSRRVLAEASLEAQTAVVSAWSLACAKREAAVSAAALVASLQAASANELQLVLASQHNARLQREIGAARDVVAVNAAFEAWRTSLRGTAVAGDTSMGLMGQLVIAGSGSLLAAVVLEAHGHALDLRGAYDAAVLNAKGLFGVDAVALGTASASLDASFRAELGTVVRTTMTTLSEAEQARVVALLITIEGCWR
jgi:hypothetical protein